MAEEKDLAGHWLEQHTAPVRAKPNSRPCLEGARYKYLTSCSFLLNLAIAFLYQGGALAQRVEHWTCDQLVVGSVPARGKAA